MKRSRWRQALATPLGISATALVVILLVLAVAAPILWTDVADQVDTDLILAPPSADHWLGTDNLGRDLFYRVLVATRLSVGLALGVTAISVVVGLVLGTAPFFLTRRLGRLATASVNIAVAFPGLLLALFLAVVFGVGTRGVVLALGLAGAPSFARLCQNLIAGIARRDYLTAASILGVGRFRQLVRHVLPNIGEPLIVNATIGTGGALLALSGLSFLGLGVQAPAYDWGRLLQDGLARIFLQPMAAIGPGIAIVIAGLAINLFGEAMAKGLGVDAIALGPMIDGGAQSPPAKAIARVEERQHGSAHEVPPEAPVLDVDQLTVTLATEGRPVQPVRGVSFSVGRGEAVGVVGESGAGKTLTALAVASLIEPPDEVMVARLSFLGTDLTRASPDDIRQLLGNSMAVVFQDPLSSFNPTQRMGRQLAEVSRIHGGMSRSGARDRAAEKLGAVHVPDPHRRAGQYPHEFSGGMRQRAMIAMGLMASPALIIADEPTTALDVTVQRQILNLLDEIRREKDVAILMISHDVTVLHSLCDRILVMYAGRIVEDLPAAELESARHPYTRALIDVVPDMDTPIERPLATIPGTPVEPKAVPPGCAYAPRCPLADAHCRAVDPELIEDRPGRRVACWHAGEVWLSSGDSEQSLDSPDVPT
jgi:peptide/nickel transport system permease protein